MDQHGCGENDPNGPVFDPVHGVFHHFYQIHLSAPISHYLDGTVATSGHGPDYGHFVSKDFIHWAALPTAIWNGFDASTTPLTVTKYDNEAIFTGSAQIFDGAGPGGKGPGVVNIYPGLCNKQDWPKCETGTLLAQAVPADYAGDELLVNWTKPSYNPIMENTQRDPSSPWKTPFGTWRLRTFNQHVYEAASDEAVLKGQWKDLGVNKDFRGCECPSFYPLPAPTPGFEAEYEAMRDSGLPTNVHKTSCGGDWWQLGTYSANATGKLGSFNATPGWEDLFVQRKIDQGKFYASKDNVYPTKDGGSRRINWGWAQVPPASTQTLPREITFNAAARCLQQYPIEELSALRGTAVKASGAGKVNLPAGAAKNSEILATFDLPDTNGTFGVTVGSTNCSVDYVPGAQNATVSCGGTHDIVPLLSKEKTFEIRVYSDATFLEAYFQRGRSAMTVVSKMDASTTISLVASQKVDATAWPIKGIWTTPEAVRAQKRVYGAPDESLRQASHLDE